MKNSVEIRKFIQDGRIWYTVSYYDKDIKAFKEFDDIDDATDFTAFLLMTCEPILLEMIRRNK